MNKSWISIKMLMVVTCIMVFNQSCTDLEEEVFSELTTETFPITDEQLTSALAAAYTSLYNFGSHNSFYSLNLIASDEALIPQRGSDWFDGGQWIRVNQHDYNANEQAVGNGWNTLFGSVNDCNRVISLFEDRVADGAVEEADAAILITELKVLRAYVYYWLLDLYGNVPIVDDFNSTDSAPPTKSRAEVYAFIEKELAENVPNLNQAKDITTYARFNYWAGKALQAKLYLNAEVYTGTPKWAECAAACDELINSGLYSMEGDYFVNFDEQNEGSNENIFVIPYDKVFAQGFNWSQMTLHYSSQNTFNLNAQPWNGYCAMTEIYNSYSDDDVRKGEFGNQKVRGNFLAGPQFLADGTTPATDSGVESSDPDGEQLVFTPEINELRPNALRQAGVRIGKYEFGGGPENMSNDFVLLRYADILLTKAEALMRNNGDMGEALDLVNMVRSRAGVDDYGELNLDNLLEERAREMFAEGTRRQDLIRFGKYGEAWQFKDASDPCKELFPIPTAQLTANANLSQNECY